MMCDGDGSDAFGSPEHLDRITVAEGAMSAPHDDSTMPQRSSVKAGDDIDDATPTSMPHAQQGDYTFPALLFFWVVLLPVLGYFSARGL